MTQIDPSQVRRGLERSSQDGIVSKSGGLYAVVRDVHEHSIEKVWYLPLSGVCSASAKSLHLGSVSLAF